MADPLRVLYVDEPPAAIDRVEGASGGQHREVTVLTERTATGAIERIRRETVECVVSEYDLPDATGIELLREVRDLSPTMPFVLFTETELATFAEAAVDAGLTDYLQRTDGDQRDQLRQTIRDAVDSRRRGSRFEETERFRTIIEQSSDIVSIIDHDGTYRYQSPSVEPILGYDPDEFLGVSVFEFVHPDDRERVRTKFFSAIENPERTPTAEYRFQHSDGSWRVLESRGTNMVDDPVVGGLVVNSRDVTDRRRREQRMNVLNRTLRHDLRNAMNVILGNAELLMREYGSDDRAETVRSTAADMLELSNKVRDIEQALDVGDEPREMVDLVSVIEEHLSAVRRGRPDVTVETDLPESEWVLANDRIGAALDNAIENAIEHNDAGDGLLRVSIEDGTLAGDDAVTVVVADDGPGIPDDELDVITQGGESPLEHTSGLGLWLIKWIVTESAGDIEFTESEAGGTAVRMTLQRAQVGNRIDVG